MFKKILIAIDYAEESSWQKALPLAVEQARLHGAELSAITVVPEVVKLRADCTNRYLGVLAGAVFMAWTTRVPGQGRGQQQQHPASRSARTDAATDFMTFPPSEALNHALDRFPCLEDL